jgi:hypothetical protein
VYRHVLDHIKKVIIMHVRTCSLCIIPCRSFTDTSSKYETICTSLLSCSFSRMLLPCMLTSFKCLCRREGRGLPPGTLGSSEPWCHATLGSSWVFGTLVLLYP